MNISKQSLEKFRSKKALTLRQCSDLLIRNFGEPLEYLEPFFRDEGHQFTVDIHTSRFVQQELALYVSNTFMRREWVLFVVLEISGMSFPKEDYYVRQLLRDAVAPGKSFLHYPGEILRGRSKRLFSLVQHGIASSWDICVIGLSSGNIFYFNHHELASFDSPIRKQWQDAHEFMFSIARGRDRFGKCPQWRKENYPPRTPEEIARLARQNAGEDEQEGT